MQSPIAERALCQPSFISLSVLMETVWLMTSRYHMSRTVAAAAMLQILDVSTVSCEQEPLARWALAQFAKGAAIADMIHLISARHQTSFATFDRDMIRQAGADCPVQIEILA